MSKRINVVVTKCADCPYIEDHTFDGYGGDVGGMTTDYREPPAAWECGWPNGSNRDVPFRHDGIPDWCPLPDDTETPDE